MYVLTWYIFHKFGSLDDTRRNPIFLGLYVALTSLMALFIFRDWKQDVQDVLRAENSSNEVGVKAFPTGAVAKVILSNWVEVVLLVFMFVILVATNDFLHYATLALWAVLILRELFQLTVSVKR